MSQKQHRRQPIPDDPWKNARQLTLSNGILQVVGLSSPTHTVFGRILFKEGDNGVKTTMYQLVQWLLAEIHNYNQNGISTFYSADDLLQLGSIWVLHSTKDGETERVRMFSENSGRPIEKEDTIRVHFLPNRFFGVYDVDWSHPLVGNGSLSNGSKLPNAVVDCNDEMGFLVVNKPSGVPSHATVDNGVEDVLDQLKKVGTMRNSKLTLPQRLDIETTGLLLVATRPEFASYLGHLVQKKTTTHSNKVDDAAAAESSKTEHVSIRKYYRCLLHVPTLEHRNELQQHLKYSYGIITHYMDPSSTAPKTFQLTERKGWMKCLLRVLDVGACMYLKIDEKDAQSISTNKALVMEVKVELLTGRTHQIRGQFSNLGFPLIGDPLYRGLSGHGSVVNWNKTRGRIADNYQTRACDYLGLQCCYLSFPNAQKSTNQKGLPILQAGHDLYCFELQNAWWTDHISVLED